jgi:toxin ParE1/3/4
VSFRVTRAADADLEDIGRYTLRRWGPQQATGYLRDIDSCFGRLAAFPKQGRARPELGEAYRVFVVRSHLIVYRTLDEGIEIVRVLHQSMDVERHMTDRESRASDHPRAPALLFLDEFLLRQLADHGLGQFGADLHGGGHLVLAEPVGEERLQLLEVERLDAVLEPDERLVEPFGTRLPA